jgi:hypothetical protein
MVIVYKQLGVIYSRKYRAEQVWVVSLPSPEKIS